MGCFTVDVPSRGRFCLLPDVGYNVVHLATGARYCALPCTPVPIWDVLLSQKLVLERCPETFFAVANMYSDRRGRAGIPPIVTALFLPERNSVEDALSVLIAKLGVLADVHRANSASPPRGVRAEQVALVVLDIDALSGRSHLLAEECRTRYPRAQLLWLAQVPAEVPCDWRAACAPEFPFFSKSGLVSPWAQGRLRKILPALFASTAPATPRRPRPAPQETPRFASREEELLASLCAWQASKRR
ncbi:MAG TPA: hypothetical protein VMH32_03905 [Burkholderiales bacterium]|nr:hypothetical protein [Burkholderiales bacterium]